MYNDLINLDIKLDSVTLSCIKKKVCVQLN